MVAPATEAGGAASSSLGVASAVFLTMPTAAALPTGVLKNGRLRLTNSSGAAAVPATLYADAAANASSAAHCFLNGVSIPANSSIEVDIPTLKAGDTVRGLAGTAAIITVHEMGGVIYS